MYITLTLKRTIQLNCITDVHLCVCENAITELCFKLFTLALFSFHHLFTTQQDIYDLTFPVLLTILLDI